MTRVLIVDDDAQLLRALSIDLRGRHYDVDTATTGSAALALAARTQPDLVILDLGLPDFGGTEVIRGLRGWTNVPIIVLSGRTGSADKIGALDRGADDYVTKPFSMDELHARIRAALRRHDNPEPAARYHIGDWVVDLTAHTVTRPKAPATGAAPTTGDTTNGNTVHLTRTEWNLLEVLLHNAGKLVESQQLLAQVWGPGYQRETNYLRFYMSRLRGKLEPEPSRPRHLLTEPGYGYRYRP
ncbi:MAG: two-component system, OmpR family, operon response regulator KdpE [Pseudonocardiales bacterium]|nr:two-component system, OmpR family, operon response regulator KdpE [Pseudonocardiales bacterium]